MAGAPFSVTSVPGGGDLGRFYIGVDGDGVYESTNGGRTFGKVFSGSVHHVAVYQAKPWRVAAGTNDGVALSLDRGVTWTMLDKRLPARKFNVVAFAGQRLLAGSAGGGGAERQTVNPFLNLSPPPGATVLFDGTNLDRWVKRSYQRETAAWPLTNGEMTTRGGDIVTRDTFRDFRLHVEFCCPERPTDVTGQKRSNSGVFLQGRYEIQVLDSWGKNPPGKGDCGALYNVAAPLVNACAPGGAWQSYDVFFRAARFDAADKKTEAARVTLLHNGVVVHNNALVPRPTGGALGSDETRPGPLLLQDHGDAVRYRNIWIVPLPLTGSDRY